MDRVKCGLYLLKRNYIEIKLNVIILIIIGLNKRDSKIYKNICIICGIEFIDFLNKIKIYICFEYSIRLFVSF